MLHKQAAFIYTTFCSGELQHDPMLAMPCACSEGCLEMYKLHKTPCKGEALQFSVYHNMTLLQQTLHWPLA